MDFNYDVIGQLIGPSPTTINYPDEYIGQIAATHLISHLKGIITLDQTSTIVVHRISRESTNTCYY